MDKEVSAILSDAVKLAAKYKKLTGKPLGITGEVAEFSAAALLGLKLAPARTAGYDAIGPGGRKVQIKGRCSTTRPQPGQRIGAIRLGHEWDSVLLVLLDESYAVTEMWEAMRAEVTVALQTPGSKARNERGQLSVSNFKKIAKRRWP